MGDWILWVNVVTMWVAVALTLASGVDYVVNVTRPGRKPTARWG